MKKIELEIVALSHSISQAQSYAVVLGEIDGLRRLPIVIGGFEAQAIAVALEHMKPSRPLTHDLFVNFLTTYNVDLVEVAIYKIEEGIFYAKLICSQNNQTVEIDSRTSDALALAVRVGCKIFTYENILETAGLMIEPGEHAQTEMEPGIHKAEKKDNELKSLNLEELEELLQQVLDQEDYSKAIRIRDEINSRKSQ